MKVYIRHPFRAGLFFVLCAVLLSLPAYAASQVTEFDYGRYASDNPDVQAAYGTELHRNELYLHYLYYGAAEGRTAYSSKTGEKFILADGEVQAYEKQKGLKTPKERMEAAELMPDRNWSAPLLAEADEVIANVGGSTPYEKLQACYDWLIMNCSYASADAGSVGGSMMERLAYTIFKTHTGVCNDYSSAFVVMARILGYDARLESGQTHKASGGYTGHMWCVINVHGVDYIFDPQVEDNMSAGGKINYLRFCKTYDEVPDKYILVGDDPEWDRMMTEVSLYEVYAYVHSSRT